MSDDESDASAPTGKKKSVSEIPSIRYTPKLYLFVNDNALSDSDRRNPSNRAKIMPNGAGIDAFVKQFFQDVGKETVAAQLGWIKKHLGPCDEDLQADILAVCKNAVVDEKISIEKLKVGLTRLVSDYKNSNISDDTLDLNNPATQWQNVVQSLSTYRSFPRHHEILATFGDFITESIRKRKRLRFQNAELTADELKICEMMREVIIISAEEAITGQYIKHLETKRDHSYVGSVEDAQDAFKKCIFKELESHPDQLKSVQASGLLVRLHKTQNYTSKEKNDEAKSKAQTPKSESLKTIPKNSSPNNHKNEKTNTPKGFQPSGGFKRDHGYESRTDSYDNRNNSRASSGGNNYSSSSKRETRDERHDDRKRDKFDNRDKDREQRHSFCGNCKRGGHNSDQCFYHPDPATQAENRKKYGFNENSTKKK